MSGKSAVTVLAASLTLVSAAQAGQVAPAQIATVTGSVVAIQAKGTTPAKAGAPLALGDRLVARSGQASLRYADGCTITVKAGSMATIGAASPCASGAGLVSATPAEPAQVGKALSHLTAGNVLAATGTVLLGAAVIYGVVHADTRCDTYVDQNCNQTASP